MQRKDLTAYSELILGTSDYEIFEDAGYSGKNTDRPAFQEMMTRVRNKEFTHILVWKIDRISRNLLDFSEMYMELKKLHVIFVSKNENFDTSTAMGEAMLKIILVFAELERNMTAERVTATMISRATNGQWNGGRVPFGYDYDPITGTFSIREDEAETCLMMKDDYLKHKSLLHTCRMLNSKSKHTRADIEWSPTTVHIVLSNPFYCGTYRYNKYKGTENRTINPQDEWVLIPNHHPAIFTTQEHEQILSILKDNARKINTPEQSFKRKYVHIFQGLCYCGKCGSRMTSTPGKIQSDGYRSSIYSCPKHRKTKECDNPSINDIVIGNFVLNYIANIIHAKQDFAKIKDINTLQDSLLNSRACVGIKEIAPEGLEELYYILSNNKSKKNFKVLSKKKTLSPELQSLKKEYDKQSRALKRLQELYLYSDNSMSNTDFISQKQKITSRLEEIDRTLRAASVNTEKKLSDSEFIKKASYLLITSQLQDAPFIYYKKLAMTTSSEVLQEYIQTIIQNIYITDGNITEITFQNGNSHSFIWK